MTDSIKFVSAEEAGKAREEMYDQRRMIYAMIARLANLKGNQTIPTEDVIDLAWGVKLLMEQVFNFETLVTIVPASEPK